MIKLIEEIKAANIAFAAGTPFLTDAEYDVIWKQLFDHDPNNHNLYHTTHDPTIPCDHRIHHTPIKGVQKAFDMEDLKPFIARFGSEPLLIEPKYDGVAAVIYRTPEQFVHELTLFGDGYSGRDITTHLRAITCENPVTLFDRVELIIPFMNWDTSYGKNPRNTVAGWVARSEIPYPDIIEAIPHDNGPLCQPFEFTSFDELENLLLSLYSEWSAIVPMDGLMIKLADHKKRIQVDDHPTFYHWSVAWKPPISTKETTVTDIEWNVSRSGRVIPTVIYEELELCGTLNTRATGNNAAWIRSRNISIGSKITVGKAGEIIPKILKPLPDLTNGVATGGHAGPVPMECPKCGSSLGWYGVDLICADSRCIAQLSKSIAYFYSDKGIEIKGIGEAMIAELLEDRSLYDILCENPWALLEPFQYGIDQAIESVWGSLRSQNYLTELKRASSRYDPARFIAALGYKGLAYKSALKIFQQIKGAPAKSNVPRAALDNFIKALGQLSKAKEHFKSFSLTDLPPIAKITYCITGELSSSRNDMIEYLATKAWQFSNQVSKHTDILILGEYSRVTTKHARAKELGIRIITEEELPSLIKENE